jgi:hypothetical protein
MNKGNLNKLFWKIISKVIDFKHKVAKYGDFAEQGRARFIKAM